MRRWVGSGSWRALILLGILVAIPLIGVLVAEFSRAAGGQVGSGDCLTTVSETSTVSVTSAGGKCIYTFTSGSNSITPPTGAKKIDFLVVGGGGGGGSNRGGGGGAGGLYESNFTYTSGAIDVTVGAGGAGGSTPTGNVGIAGGDGGQSVILGGGASFAAGGGGGGGAHALSGSGQTGRNGVAVTSGYTGPTGSGGGASMNYSGSGFSGGTGYSGSNGYGNAGAGSRNDADPTRNTGGGGGAGGAGVQGSNGDCNASSGTKPDGGSGRSSSITGSSNVYAAGGGGGDARGAAEICGGTATNMSTAGAGAGGSSIGGTGAGYTGVGSNAVANTGSGGGGGGSDAGGAGSAGVVILSIDATKPVSSGTTSTDVLPKASSSVTVAYSATDSNSVSSVTAYYSASADLSSPTSCGSATGLSGTSASGNITCTVPSSPVTTKTYYVFTVATDASGVVENAPTTADDTFVHDAITPLSTATASRTAVNSTTVPILYSATDAVGLTSVKVYYTSNSNLQSGTLCGTASVSGTSASGSIDCVQGTLNNGWSYYYYTVATDTAGQVEVAADYTPAAVVKYDVSSPLFGTRPFPGDNAGPGAGVAVSSSEVGTAYLVKTTSIVSTEAAILALDGALWNSVAITAANTDVVIPAGGLSEGTHVVYLVDEAGNLSNPSENVTIDNTTPNKPTVSLDYYSDLGLSPTDGLTSLTTPRFNSRSNEYKGRMVFTAVNGATTVTCTSNFVSYITDGTNECSFGTLASGTWSVTAVHIDGGGNVSPTSDAVTLTIDTTAPTAPVTTDLLADSDWGTSATDNRTASTSPNVSVTALPEASGTIEIRTVVSGTTYTCSYTSASTNQFCPLSLPSLNATNTVQARFIDAAGNASAWNAGLSVTFDTIAPSLSFPSALAAGYGASDNWLGVNSEAGSIHIVADQLVSFPDIATLPANQIKSFTSNAGANTLLTTSGLTSDATYYVHAMDAAGNLSAASNSFIIDAVAPTVVRVYGTDGSYKQGAAVNITVEFSEAVVVVTTGGTPYLSTGAGNASYVSGSGTANPVFRLNVPAGTNIADLNYSTTLALTLNSGTIRDVYRNSALVTLPLLNAAESLASQSNIRIDTTVPSPLYTLPATPTNAGTLMYTINYGEVVTGLSAANFTLGGTAGSSCASKDLLTSDSIVYYLYVFSCGEGTVTAVQAANTAADAAGNLGPVSAVTSLAVTVDRTAPTITACVCGKTSGVMGSAGTLTSLTSNSAGTGYLVRSSRAVSLLSDITSAPDDQWNSVSITGAGTPTTMNPLGLGEGTYNYYATDTAGNLSAAYTTSSVTVDNTKPTFTFTAPSVVGPSTTRPSSSSNEIGSVLYVNRNQVLTNPVTYPSINSKAGHKIFTGITTVNTPTFSQGIVTGSTFSSGVYDGYAIDEAGNVSDPALSAFTVDTTSPSVVDIYTTAASGTYYFGSVIPIFVTMSEPVNVSNTPTLMMEAGAIDRNATYVSGSGTNTLRFEYTVQSGDYNVDLDLVTGANLSTGAANRIGDLYGNPDSNVSGYSIPKIGSATAGSISNLNDIVVDGSVPTVTGVSSASGNQASYSATFTFNLDVTDFDSADVSNVGTATGCTVAVSATSARVYVSTFSNCSDGTIIPRVRVDAAALPTGVTGPKSLYNSATITKDTTAPVVTPSSTVFAVGPNQSTNFSVNGASTVYFVNTSVTVTNVASITGATSNLWKSFTYTTGTTTVTPAGVVDGTYKFYAVDSYGNLSGASTSTYTVDTVAPTVTLIPATIGIGGSATVRSSESGSVYIVRNSVAVSSLSSITGSGSTNYKSASAPTANTDTAVTVSGVTSGTFVAYATDEAMNLSVVSTDQVTVDVVAPIVMTLKAVADGTYILGDTVLIDTTFNDTVFVDTTGGTPTLDLNGATPNANYVSGSGTSVLRFSYTVGVGDSSSDLNVVSGSSLSNGGGTIKDAAGNNAVLTVPSSGSQSLSTQSAVVVDGIRPTVTALTATTPTKAASFAYTSTFGEVVYGIEASDYQITGTATGCTATPSATSGSSITVTLSGCSDGTVVLTLLSNSVRDVNGNTAPTSNFAGTSVTVDRVGPVPTFTAPVTPTTATTLTYTITFNESMSGLASTDFTRTGTATGCVIGSPSSASGTSVTISITGCSAGTVGLALNANSVSDSALNTGPEVAVSAATVTRDLTPPAVSSLVWAANPTNSTAPSFTITFGESVTGLTNADFTFGGTATGCAVSPGASSGTAIVVTLSGCSTGTVTPTLAVNAVTDLAGNNGPTAAFVGAALTIDRTAPSAPNAPTMAAASDTGVSSSDARTRNNSVTVTVSTPEATGSITVTATSGVSAVTCNGSVASSSGSCLLVGLSEGTWTLSATFADAADNVSGSSTSSTFVVDNTAPTVSITSPTGPIMSFPVSYTLTFSEAVNGLTSGGISNSTGTALGCTFTPASSSGTVINVSVTGCGDGTLAMQLNANTVSDVAGNSGPIAGEVTPALQIDSGPPTVILSAGTKKNDQSATVRSSKPGTAYLVRSSVTVSALTDITGAADNLWNSVAVTTVNTDTQLSLDGLTDGTYRAYAIDSQSRLSVVSSVAFVVDNTAPNTPTSVTLVASSDSGISSSDGRTNDGTPTVGVVTAENGGTVTVTASKSGQASVTCTMSGSTTGGTCDLASLVDGTWTLSATQTDVAGNESAAVTGSMIIDTVGPSVSNVSTDSGDGPFKAGATVGMKYIFNEVLYVTTTGGTPKVQMETGVTDEDASYTSGSGSTTLIFAFVVRPGNTASDLSYTSATAMTLNGGLMRDAAGNPAVLTLPAPGAAYSLSWNRNMVVDTTAPADPTSVVVAASSDSGASSSDGITSDTTPTIRVTAAEDGGTVSVSASRPGRITVECTMTGATSGGVCDLGTLTEGTWTVTAKQSDLAGNIGGSVTISLVVDVTAPSVSAVVQSVRSASSATVRSTEAGTAYVVSSSVPVSTLADISGAADTSWNSGAVAAANADTGVAMTGLTEGTYKVFAVDVAGNFSSGSAADITVDDTSPVAVAFTGPSSPNRNTSLPFTLTFDGVVGDLTSADFTNTGTASGCVFTPSASSGASFTVTASSCGEGTLVVGLRVNAVTDTAGNTAPSAVYSASSVMIDRTAPNAPVLNSAVLLPTSDATVRVDEATDVYLVNSTVTVTDLPSITGRTGTLWNQSNVGSINTDTAFALSGLIDGVYRAYSVDAAGNVSPASANSVTVDSTSPTVVITAAPGSVASGGTSTITFTLNENVTGFSAGDVTTGLGVLSNFSGSGTTYTATFSASSVAGGLANITVAAGAFVDAANNTNASASGSVSVASPTGSNQRQSAQSGQTNYIIEQFLTPGTSFWRAPQNVTRVEYLVVGGGGGGGGGGFVAGGNGGGGGGGGAGSVSTGISLVTPGTEYTIMVGQGGAGGSGGSPTDSNAPQGRAGVGGSASHGITGSANGGNGGCPSALNASTANCGHSTITHGYGGYGGRNSDHLPGTRASVIGGGGGGGAGSGGAGGSTSTSSGGSAGSGTVTNFYGTEGTFGIGGAGGVGAAGAIAGSSASTRGSAGSGGSGGLNGSSGGAGGNGADGLVVIRYAVPSISALDLDVSDDSGASNTDDLTNVTTPTFTGVAPVGATVQLYVDGVASGAPCTADSATGVFACDTGAMSDGSRSVVAKSSVLLSGGPVESTSPVFTVVLDLVPPTPTLSTATVNWGETATARSSERGTAYLVKDTVTVTDLASITLANTNVWNSVAITTVDTDAAVSSSGLISGSYKLYTVDEAGNLSTASSGTVTYVDDLTAPTITLTNGRLRGTQSAVVSSTEKGTAYLVRNTVAVSSLVSIVGAPANTKASVSITTANTNTNIALAGLLEGTYRAFAVDPAGNLSAESTATVYVDLTAPVVSSLSSSATSYVARTFDFTLTMSEGITGLEGTDFGNAGTANSCTFAPDASSGTTFTVTVTCSSDGTVVARLAADSITDLAGISGPATVHNGASVNLGATPTKLVLSTTSAGTASGAAFTTQPAVTMKNAQNLVVTGVSATVTATITQVNGTGVLVGTTTATVDTNTGVATFVDLGVTGTAGTQYAITYSSGSLITASQNVTVSVGAATALAMVTQPAGGASGAQFATQPVVRIVDSGGNTVTGATASVSVGSSTGSIGGTRPRVTSGGVATFTDLTFSGLASQSHTLTFSATGLAPVSSASFNISAGAASQLVLVTQSVGTESGAAFTTQPVLEIRDSGGNRVGSSTATVTATVNGGATLEGTRTATATSGTAVYVNLGISGTAGTPYTITYSSPGLASAVQSVTPTVGPAVRLLVTTQPVGAGAGALLATQPSVRVVDSGNNVIVGSTATVVVTSTSGSVDGSLVVNASAGEASYSNLTFAGTAGVNHRLTFSSYGLLPADSDNFTVSVGAPTHLAVTRQPIGATAGASFATQPVVKVLDAGQNVVTGSTVQVVASPSGGVLGGSTTMNAVAGVATYVDLTFAGTVATDYTLTFAATSLTPATSSTFRVGVGAASKLVLTTAASGARYSQAFDTQPVVEVQDAGGNRTASNAVVTATVGSGTVLGGVGATKTATAVNGVATFAGLGIVNPPATVSIDYSSGSLVGTGQTIALNRADQVIGFDPLTDRDYDGTPFPLSASSTAGLTVSYTTADPQICSVSGDRLTMRAIGLCSVTATQNGDVNHNAAQSVTRSFTIARATPRVTLAAITNKTFGTTYYASASADAPVLMDFDGTPNVCTVATPTLTGNTSRSLVTMVGAGRCTITVSRAQDALYNAAVVSGNGALSRQFDVLKADGTITFDATTLAQTYDGSGRSVIATVNSGTLTITYTGIAPTVYAPSTTPPVNAGSYAVVAVQNDVNYEATEPATLVVGKAVGAITLDPASLTQSYSGTSRSAVVASTTPASSASIVTYTGIQGTVYGPSAFAPTNAGTYNVTAVLNSINHQASVSGTLNVGLGVQSTIGFINASTTTYGENITLIAVGGTGTGAMTYSVTSGSCTVNPTSGLLVPTGTGSCIVTATRGSSGNFGATSSAPFTVTVSAATQIVGFTSTLPPTPLPGTTYTPTAVATSGLAPTFTVTDGDGTVCTLDPGTGTVSIVASGTCEITVEQAGNSNWLPADPVTQVMVAGRLNQSITFASVPTKNFGDPVFALGATASSGRAVTYTVVSGASTCSVSAGGTVTLAAVGTCVIDASQDGDSVYLPANDVRRVITVVPTVPSAPFLSSVSTNDGSVTVAYSAPSTDGGMPIQAYTVLVRHSGSDRSLDVVRTDCPLTLTCLIDGLTNGQQYTVTLTASNVVGNGPSSTESPLLLPILNPTAVRGLTARAGDQLIDVEWNPPASLGGGAFTRYEISIRTRSGSYQTPISVTDANATSYRFAGLDNGTGYDVKVVTITTAELTEFTGNTAEVFEMPRTTPTPPRDVTISAPTGRVARVSWRVPMSDGGAVITSYTTNVANSVCAMATPVDVVCEISGLTPGSPLSVEVRAVNSVGESQPMSAAINLPNRPQPPSLRSVVVDVSTALVEWSPPVSDGGQPILGYLVYATESGLRNAAVASPPIDAHCVTASTTCQIDNLDPTKKYVFAVRAVNTVGESDLSNPLDPFPAVSTTSPNTSPVVTLPRTGKAAADGAAVVSWWLLLAGMGVAVSMRRHRRRSRVG